MNVLVICITKLNMLDLYFDMEDYESAHELGGEVYRLAEQLGAKRIGAMALSKIGIILQHKKKLVGAEKAFNDAIDLFVQMEQTDPRN